MSPYWVMMGIILILTPVICWAFTLGREHTRTPLSKAFSVIHEKRYYLHALGYIFIIKWKSMTDDLNEPIKTRTGNWTVIDIKRDTFNVTTKRLSLNLSTDETSQVATTIDILSNGFKCRTNSGDVNNSTNTYIYCAWAEAPTVNLYGGQSNGR